MLHDRVDRWVHASASRLQGAAQFVAGIIPEALHVSDPDLGRALTERAAGMNSRARTLAEQAVAQHAAWTRQLGPFPADPRRRELWLREVATVAAYRERWSVTGADPVSATRASVERLGHEKRAAQAAQRAQVIAYGLKREEQDVGAGRGPVPENGVEL